MSVLACTVDKKKIIICSDSIVVYGEEFQRKDRTTKLQKVNNMLVGFAGSTEEGALFIRFCKSRRPERVTPDGVQDFLTDFLADKIRKTEKSEIDNAFLLAIDGKAFIMEGFEVKQIEDYEAIGMGKPYAITALYLGHDAKTAVEVAIEHSMFCEYPIVTKTMKVKK